jgi:acyl-CoA synthetase (AMP-forming)/AMP-acid ligase II
MCSHLVSGYGATETAMSTLAPGYLLSRIEGVAGYVIPDVRIEIVDDADCPLPLGTEGIVRIASEVAVDGYLGDPVESAKVFRNGWVYPGDLGTLTADNLLVISGRRNDVLNVGGSKIAAEKVEAAVASFPGVTEAAVLLATNEKGVPEIWTAIVGNKNIDPDALRVHCRTKLPHVFAPVHVVPIEALPISAVGKLDRLRLREIVIGQTGGESPSVIDLDE